MTRRRVVITGLGMVSPLGLTVADTWQQILAGRSGISDITEFDTSAFSVKFAGLVKNFTTGEFLSAQDAKKCDTFIQYGLVAGCQAVVDAGLATGYEATSVAQGLNLDRIGVCIGSGIGGLSTIESVHDVYNKQGPRRITPFFIPATIINMISGHLSIKYGFRGPNLAVTTACTTGTHAIGLAARMIRYNDADIVIAGGSEKASTPLGIGGFAAARALSTNNAAQQQASRPWDRDRDGFVLGDGAGVLVLEEYEHAKARGARIYAEVLGFGMTGDAYHMTRPSGTGAVMAMTQALADGQCNAEEVHYVNAHATATKAGDVEESLAIIKALGEHHSKGLLVSATKSMTGHLLGATGAVEAIFTALALRDQVAPPTINLQNLDPDCDLGLDYVANGAKPSRIDKALSNSFGFGGTNGCLLFGKV